MASFSWGRSCLPGLPAGLLICGLSATLSVQAQSFSGLDQAPEVIELYTSEGCSSCPPADKFLSSLKDNPGIFTSVFPLAFHVDYWDYIGWKDPYAKQAFSQRQRGLERSGRVSQVYTPGFVANGQEWRRWFSGERKWPENQSETTYSWHLQVTTNHNKAELKIVGWRPELADMLKGSTFHAALLGMGLVSEVSMGENKGRTLRHDFVVMEYQEGTIGETWGNVSTAPGAAIVVWVSDSAGRPLRAAGGILQKG